MFNRIYSQITNELSYWNCDYCNIPNSTLYQYEYFYTENQTMPFYFCSETCFNCWVLKNI
jgi:hypothetical protein